MIEFEGSSSEEMANVSGVVQSDRDRSVDTSAEPQRLRSNVNVLRAMQGDDELDWGASSLSGRLFTDEDLSQVAAGDEELFGQLLRRGIKRTPESIFRAFEDVSSIVPREELRPVLDSMAEVSPYSFFNHVSEVQAYYSPDELRNVVAQASTDSEGQGAGAVLENFLKPEIADLYTPDEGKTIVLEASSHVGASSLTPHILDQCREREFLSVQDVQTVIIDAVRRDYYAIHSVEGFEKYFPGEERDRFKHEVLQGFTRGENSFYLTDLEKVGDLVTDDEKKELLRGGIQEDPKEMDYAFDVMKKYLPAEEVAAWLQEGFIQGYAKDLVSYTLRDTILTEDYFSEEIRAEYRDIVIQSHPDIALEAPDVYMTGKDPEDRTKLILESVERVHISQALHFAETWLPLVTPEESEQKQILQDLIERENDFSFLQSADRYRNPVATLFPPDELRALFDRQVSLGVKSAFESATQLATIKEYLGSDREFRDFVRKGIDTDITTVLQNMNEVSYLFSEDEIADLLIRASATQKGVVSTIDYLRTWGPLVTQEFAHQYVKEQKYINSLAILSNINTVLQYIPSEERRDFFSDLVQANPVVASTVTPESIEARYREIDRSSLSTALMRGQYDEEKISFAPQVLKEFYHKVGRFSEDSASRMALLVETSQMYEAIARIEQSGLAAEYKAQLASQTLTPQQERTLLDIYYCFSLMRGSTSGESSERSYGTTIEESGGLLVQELGTQFGIESELTDDEKKRFLTTMGTPAPFFTYNLQYKDSPPHQEILKNMFTGIISGEYSFWKFGEPTQESLDALKELHLLPQDITFEQYSIWREDESTTLHEALSVDAHNVSKGIRRVLLENNDHLQSEALEQPGEPSAIVGDLQNEMKRLGQELASVNKTMSGLRKESGGAAGDLEKLSEQKEVLGERMNQLKVEVACVRLATLRPEEITTGYLLEGETLEKKTKKLTQVIGDIKKEIAPEDQFVLDRVTRLLDDFQNQSQEKQNLVCQDSGDPKVLIEVGSKPVGSCQHYAHGSYNECLLGYSDPNTKILLLKNEKGNAVARSIFRVLEDNDGKSSLHIEQVYSASASPGVLRSIYTHASRKAEQMGMPLYVSKVSQNEEGTDQEAEVPVGFTSEKSDKLLRSTASRAPKVYVDSADGETSWGKFTLNDLLLVQKAA